MKAILIYSTLMLLLFPLAFCNNACTMETHPMKRLTNQQKGQTIALKPGEIFMLVLPNPSSGGYVVKGLPEFDPQILICEKSDKELSTDADRDGDFGKLVWKFQTKNEGRSSIIVRVFRPWEKDIAPIVIFEASVNVAK